MIRYLPLALCLLALPAAADLYKWTDENGELHYSDQPPPSTVKNTDTIKHVRPTPAGAAAPKSVHEQEMEFRKRRLQAAEAEAKAQKDAQVAEEKKQNCQRATQQVVAFERGGRVTRYGPNGEQIFMTDAEIAQELIQARKTADSWCK